MGFDFVEVGGCVAGYETLIASGVATLPAKAAAPSKKRSLDETASDDKEKHQQQQQQPAKKPRRRKLPKDYDPEKKSDPERWLLSRGEWLRLRR